MNIRLLAVGILASVGPTLTAQTIQVNKENKTIAITATDSAEREADTAVISIGFVDYGTEQDQTYADASRISNQIVNALLNAGLKKEQIRSDSQRLTPLDYSDKARWDKRIRFEFSQTWRVTTTASNAAEVLHLAVTAGANDSGGPSGGLRTTTPLRLRRLRRCSRTHVRSRIAWRQGSMSNLARSSTRAIKLRR